MGLPTRASIVSVCLLSLMPGWAAAVEADRSTYDAQAGVDVKATADAIDVTWPLAGDGRGRVVFNLDPARPLIASMAVGDAAPILRDVDPAVVVTVGTRDLTPAGWTIFFDNPRRRPYTIEPMSLARTSPRVVTENGRTSIVFGGAKAGPFAGDFRFTFYPGSALVRAAATMSTDRPATAYLYDAGLVASADRSAPWKAIAHRGLNDRINRIDDPRDPVVLSQARHRTVIAEGREGGSVALVPPPHQYSYPLDFVDNFATVWTGRDYRGLADTVGFGVRQTVEGDRRWVPWVNAPPGTTQEMSVFYLLGAGDAGRTLDDVLAYTRGDRFKPLPGRVTFTSHYHVEHTLDLLNRQKAQKTAAVPEALVEPDFVKVFKAMGVDVAHLGEFHEGDRELAIADRLTRLKVLHDECARLSTDSFLMLPGEEPNVHLGGHWVSFFPKPVMWTLDRAKDQPFVEDHPTHGKVYHVGSAADVLALMEAEGGLMWTAHPRIKASTAFPDAYRSRDFFKSDRYLGGAWKAMPADYAQPRLGSRVLGLLDDMNNWAATQPTGASQRKQAPGEVDVFKIDRNSELYAHMNVNYLRLDALPRFADGWQPIVDALRGGRFFTTTGEVLIDPMTIDGKASGETIANPPAESTLVARLEWTFPLTLAEIVSGDGEKVYRQRIDLGDTRAFGSRELRVPIDLRGKRWVRLEAWDVAASGAYTQPIWIE